MIRIPALKTQVAILKAELNKQGVTLQHAAALEIVALQNGFKNWRHAVEANGSAKTTPGSVDAAPESPVTLELVFGMEDVRQYRDYGHPADELNTYQALTFATAAEKQAFLDGLEEGSGWSEYAVVEPKPGLETWSGLNGEDAEPLIRQLKALGFKQDPSIVSAFGRPMDNGYIQYVLFDYRRSNGVDEAGPCISMDIVDEDWEYDDEVCLNQPLFFGETFAEALAKALAAADEQRVRGNALLKKLGR